MISCKNRYTEAAQLADQYADPKQKLFAGGVASGLNQSDSYRRIYNAERMASATVWNKAYALMKNGKIRARIDELREPVIQQLRYGLREAMREAEQAFVLAQAKGNPASMVAATMLRARLNGLLVKKREVTTTEVSLLADATLDRLIALKAKEAGIVPSEPLLLRASSSQLL